MNKIISHSQNAHQTWKILCWSVLLAILFQSIFITNAQAFSLQTSSIYTLCNHVNTQHDHNGINCKQHCASAIDHYTQHYLVATNSSLKVDHNNDVLAYFNPQPERLFHHRFSNKNYKDISFISPPPDPHAIYLSTSRLRI